MNKKSILVVDDNVVNRLIPGLILRPFGWDVYEAGGGIDALSILNEVFISCVLLDISMPDVNGLDVLAGIRKNSNLNNLKIIAYTAYTESKDVSCLTGLGFDSVLLKPLTSEKLLNVLKNVDVFN